MNENHKSVAQPTNNNPTHKQDVHARLGWTFGKECATYTVHMMRVLCATKHVFSNANVFGLDMPANKRICIPIETFAFLGRAYRKAAPQRHSFYACVY